MLYLNRDLRSNNVRSQLRQGLKVNDHAPNNRLTRIAVGTVILSLSSAAVAALYFKLIPVLACCGFLCASYTVGCIVQRALESRSAKQEGGHLYKDAVQLLAVCERQGINADKMLAHIDNLLKQGAKSGNKCKQ